VRDISASMLPTASRTISGRAVVYDRIPDFTLGWDSFNHYNTDVYSFDTGVFRAYNNGTIYGQEAYTLPDDLGTWGAYISGADPEGIISVCDGHIFYQKSDGGVYRHRISDGAETYYDSFDAPVAIAAVTADSFYVLYRVNWLQYRIKLYPGGSSWHGSVYGHGDNWPLHAFDAIQLDDVDYIYYQEPADKNARYIKRIGNSWSDANLVFPLDVVDDTFSFRLGSASVINNKAVIVGTMIRNNSLMKIYTFGPEQFTIGREMYIGEGSG